MINIVNPEMIIWKRITNWMTWPRIYEIWKQQQTGCKLTLFAIEMLTFSFRHYRISYSRQQHSYTFIFFTIRTQCLVSIFPQRTTLNISAFIYNTRIYGYFHPVKIHTTKVFGKISYLIQYLFYITILHTGKIFIPYNLSTVIFHFIKNIFHVCILYEKNVNFK